MRARWASLARISASSYAKGRTCMHAYAFAKHRCSLVRTPTRFVDKTPAYWEKLQLILRRAPGVPVVFVYKTRATAHRSGSKAARARRPSEGCEPLHVAARLPAQRHPAVHAVSFEDLFTTARAGRGRRSSSFSG